MLSELSSKKTLFSQNELSRNIPDIPKWENILTNVTSPSSEMHWQQVWDITIVNQAVLTSASATRPVSADDKSEAKNSLGKEEQDDRSPTPKRIRSSDNRMQEFSQRVELSQSYSARMTISQSSSSSSHSVNIGLMSTPTAPTLSTDDQSVSEEAQENSRPTMNPRSSL
jgi:hypothetical protein